MGVKESEVREMQERMGQSEVSLDQPAGASEETRLPRRDSRRRAQSGTETADREWRDFAREKVAQFAAKLEGKELEIFNARPSRRDPENSAGYRRALRDQPRTGTANRDAAEAPPERIYRSDGTRR